jgi:hypothetical protein
MMPQRNEVMQTMNEPVVCQEPDAGSGAKRLNKTPELMPAPRLVPWAIQWQFFHGCPFCIIGMFFLVVSSAFLVAMNSDSDSQYSYWRAFPLIHFSVGLGLVIAPLVKWRRRVAILKHGVLAPARIVGIQNRRQTCAQGQESNASAGDSWLEFDRAFKQMRALWGTRLQPPAILTSPATTILGCVFTCFGLYGAFWAIVVVACIWIGNSGTLGDRFLSSLPVLGFMAVWFGVLWVISSGVGRLRRLGRGSEMTPANFGMEPVAICRFVFRLPNGRETQATASVDLRSRFETGNAKPDDIAIYLPDDPQRALLLGGLSPPVAICDGEFVQVGPKQKPAQP